MNKNKKVAVISTGNGGQAIAAYLAGKRYHVSLYAREQERVDMFTDTVFHLSGAVECSTVIDRISCHMDEVIDGAYMILVTTPTQYHRAVAEAMAPCLRDGQVIVLNPGRTFGTHAMHHYLHQFGCTADVVIAETDTLVFTCRCTRPAYPVIYKIKDSLHIAAHDPTDTPRVAALMAELFGDIVRPAESVLYTSMTNIGMVFHPLPILMNITRVEAKEDFLFYLEGISPLVADVLERMDAERVAVAEALGITVPSAKQWLREVYAATGDSLYELIQSNAAYRDVLAPTDIDTRYVNEDIQTGCVPVSCAGRHLGVSTDIIDSVIDWASVIYKTDFRETGRNEKIIDFERLRA